MMICIEYDRIAQGKAIGFGSQSCRYLYYTKVSWSHCRDNFRFSINNY